VVGVVVAATAVASASEPSLPARTPAQLLTEVQQAVVRPLSPQTATIQETANLGIPALPQIGAISGQSGAESPLNLLAGTTTVDLWYLNPGHVRVAEPTQMGESDLRLDGTQLWLWDSRTQTATHVLLPTQPANGGKITVHQWAEPVPTGTPSGAPIGSPAAVASGLLKDVSPTTSVTVGPNATVAGRAAYQLVIAPRTPDSLISQIVIAIDAATHLPLRVQVYARGSSSAVFQLGYTALSLGAPAASNFTFTPPPGAKVKTITVPRPGTASLSRLALGVGSLGAAGLSPASLSGINPGGPMIGVGSAGSAGPGSSATFVLRRPGGLVAVCPVGSGLPPAVARHLRATFPAHLPKSLTKAQRAAIIKAFNAKTAVGEAGKGGSHGCGPLTALPAIRSGNGRIRVLGAGWTSVVATPASPLVAAAVGQLLSAPAGGGGAQSAGPFGGSASQAAPGQAVAVMTGPVPMGPYLAVLQALLRASTPVAGSWGSGRLLRTALLSVLVTSKGQILAGAVTPSVLERDAAALSQ